MGYNTGTYTRNHNFSADASANIKILAARVDTELDDLASALTNVVWTRDGNTVPDTDIPMGGRRHINVGAPTSVNNYFRVREFIENIPIFMDDQESSVDRISVSAQYFTSVSANQAPGDGTRILVRAGSDKSSAVLYLNGHSANVEFQDGNRAAEAMVSGGIYEMIFSSVDAAWKITRPDKGRTPAEISAGVVPTNFGYEPGDVRRYGAVGDGSTDDTTAIENAILVAHQYADGGAVYFAPGREYRTTAPIDYPSTSIRIHIFGNGATITCDHNGNGINWLVDNENYSGHTIEKLTINGPNTFLPAGGYVPPSTGAGISLNRNATTNAVTGYNNVLRDVTIQGFNVGLDLQCAIGLNVFGCFIQFNQYGVQIDGGQTNGNHFFGTHIRYNRKRGISSLGTTGGSLSNATANTFYGCLIESNIPYPFVSGGTPPTDSTAIYLNNSYDFIFDGCYSENHSASIYLAGGSKGNQFLRHRLSGGTGRDDTVFLVGAGIYSNTFDLKGTGGSGAVISIDSDNADQLYNRFGGEGLNLIAANIDALAKFDIDDIKPNLNFAGSQRFGVIKMPLHGYQENVSDGTAPGEVDGIGTATAEINAFGRGEIRLGNGITGATTITAIHNLQPGQLFVLASMQGTHDVILDASDLAANSAVYLSGGVDATFTESNQYIAFFVSGSGSAYEIGRNF